MKTFYALIALFFISFTSCSVPKEVIQPDLGTPTASLRSGPMVGYTAMREAMIWVQSTGNATFQIQYHEKGKVGNKTSAPFYANATNGYTAHIPLSYLEPGVEYEYQVLMNGQTISRPYAQRFKTNPLWQWRTDPPAFTVAFGSCYYTNEPQYDRPGRPYGGDTKIFESIRQQNPDLMLWLGDNTYYREVDWDSPEMMNHRNAHARQVPDLQALLAATSHYAIWDDHDYGPNDSDRGYILKDAALDLFKRYWANPAYGFQDTPGVFYQFSWGDADFFMTDNRFYRTPNRSPESPDKTILGKAQYQWLLDALSTSRAPFKIVVFGGQVLNDFKLYENWAQIEERNQFLADLVARKIEGVVFLSGDRHQSELIKKEVEGFYTLYDFTSSPLTSGAGKDDREANNPQRIPDTFLSERSFGLLQFSGIRTDRTLTLRALDENGQEKWNYAIKANDLKIK